MEKKTTVCKVNTHQAGLAVRTDVIAGIGKSCNCILRNEEYYCYDLYRDEKGPFNAAQKEEFLQTCGRGNPTPLIL